MQSVNIGGILRNTPSPTVTPARKRLLLGWKASFIHLFKENLNYHTHMNKSELNRFRQVNKVCSLCVP
jgi:hypothetical protein